LYSQLNFSHQIKKLKDLTLNIIAQSNITYLVDLLLSDYQKHSGNLGACGEYTIAVPSKSIENWLAAEIVKRIGISSGIRFESLHKLLNSALRLGSDDYSGLVDKRQLSAVLFKLLSELNEKEIDSSHDLTVLKT
jgi:exonuclease V gamma subunit